MNTVVKWLSVKFSKSTHKLDVDAKNRKLLYDSLELCYTPKQIQIVKNVLNNLASSFDINQKIRFTLELLEREQMIDYSHRKLKQQYYNTTSEIDSLLDKTTKHFQCDAILLHILRYKEIYAENSPDLSVYKMMVQKRKAIMLNEIQVNYECI